MAPEDINDVTEGPQMDDKLEENIEVRLIFYTADSIITVTKGGPSNFTVGIFFSTSFLI